MTIEMQLTQISLAYAVGGESAVFIFCLSQTHHESAGIDPPVKSAPLTSDLSP
jgi:hypothetical protein